MARYIEDAGASKMDAEFIGVLGLGYDYNEINKIVWFSISASDHADSKFVLPEKEWLLFEVYNPDAYVNDLGGANVHGKTQYEADVGVVADTIAAWKTAFDAATAFTTYSAKVTHYKGSDIADVYIGDESTAFTLTGGITDGTLVLNGMNFIIEDALFSDQVTQAVVVRDPVWISFGGEGASALPETLNTFEDVANTAVRSLVDINNVASDITIQALQAFTDIKNGYDDIIYCMSGKEFWRAWNFTSSSQGERNFGIYLPAGTYDLELGVIANTSETNDNFVVDYTINGETQRIDAQPSTNVGGYCKTWNIVSTGETFNLNLKIASGGYNGRVSAIHITEV